MSDPVTKPAFDAYARTPEYIQAAPKSLGGALLKIGPGLILAGAIVGTGELIATTNLGAKTGFALLWLVLFSCFIKVFVQVELGRYTMSSGDTTLQAFKRLPLGGTFFTWWWLLMMLGTQAQLAAMVGGTGQAFHRMMPGIAESFASATGWSQLATQPDLFWAPIVAIGTSIVLAVGSYKLVEVGTTFMVVGFTVMTVVCVACLPAGSFTGAEVAQGLKPQIPADAYVFAFAMFGITGVGAAELIVYPYWCIEKGYARFVGPRDNSDAWAERAKGWLRVMQLDAWVSMLVYTLATVAFYILGASILHKTTGGEGLPGTVSEMLNLLSKMYEPVLGASKAQLFISAGALAVLYSTLFAATAANGRALADFAHVNGYTTFTDGEQRKKLVRWFVILFPLLDLVIYLFFKNPVLLVTVGAVGQALTLPMVAFAAIYLRYKGTDERLRPGPIWTAMLGLSLVAFILAATYGLVDTWQKLNPSQPPKSAPAKIAIK